jgi:exosortase A-associated hydrolase 2
VVYVHPFGEEMNKSRRMAALQSRALAGAGFAVLQIDLLGCGDSSGDFGDATWADWIDDVVRAAQWLQARYDAPLWLWGLRAGCLLATDAAARLGGDCRFLFWQPAVAGKPLLQQFLRLKAAADMQQSDAKATMDALRTALAAGEAVDVAGYKLHPALAAGLEHASLEAPLRSTEVRWLELSTRDGAELLPGSMRGIEAWRQAGHAVSAAVVHGPAFWQTQEIEDAPVLIEATIRMLALTGSACKVAA